MPFQKGREKTGGRPKGYVDVEKRTVSEVCERLGLNPFEGMAIIALNKLPCGVCRGTKKTHYKLAAGTHATGCDGKPTKAGLCKCEGIGERTCESCYGTTFEACSPELRGKMNAELAAYIHPKKKAIEVSNPDGSLRPSWEVVILEAKDGSAS